MHMHRSMEEDSLMTRYDDDRGDIVVMDLFVLSWAWVRRVRWVISTELLMCGGGVRSILLLPLVARCLETNICMYMT